MMRDTEALQHRVIEMLTSKLGQPRQSDSVMRWECQPRRGFITIGVTLHLEAQRESGLEVWLFAPAESTRVEPWKVRAEADVDRLSQRIDELCEEPVSQAV